MAERNIPIRLGFIGCGRATETLHLPALMRLPGAHVEALCDVDQERLDRVADRYGIRSRHTNFLSLLDSKELDVLAVCVPPKLHAQIALAALASGKHLFVEKPLALSLDECDRLIQSAERSGCKATVGFNLRFHPLIRRTRTLLHGGTLGRLEAARTLLTSGNRTRMQLPEWRDRRITGGGVLIEVAVHHFDLWRFLLRSEVAEIFAFTRSEQTDDVTGVVNARMDNGVLVTSVFSECTNDNDELEFYGQHGRLHLSCYRFDGLEYYSTTDLPGAIGTRLRRVYASLKQFPEGLAQIRDGGGFIASYNKQWSHFLDSIRNDTPPETTLKDGRSAVEIALAAIESLSAGQPVKINAARRGNVPV